MKNPIFSHQYGGYRCGCLLNEFSEGLGVTRPPQVALVFPSGEGRRSVWKGGQLVSNILSQHYLTTLI